MEREGRTGWRKQRGHPIKFILVAVAIVALAAVPCYAQEPTGKWRQGIEEGKKKEMEERNKKAEEAYKAASDRIPEPKVKQDPWKNAR